jgi:hypothetical protein
MDQKYVLKIFIVVFLILSFIVFINSIASNNLLQVVTMEGLTSSSANSINDTNIPMNKSDAFCEKHRGSSGTLDESCGKLTQGNCNSTSCCVWTSDKKCKAGNANGPTFNTDSNGKTKHLDYYYFQNKCYGEKCSQSK